jgi:hypothetical protein
MYPTTLDSEGQDKARQMKNSTAKPGEPTAEAKAYFDYTLQKNVQQSLLNQHYYFLKATWKPVDKL